MSNVQPKGINFLNNEATRDSGDSDCYRVMVFLPFGGYPEGKIVTPNAVYHADEKIVFSVTYGSSWGALKGNLPYSEFDWASPQEIRLLASILLCERREEDLIRFYPAVGYSPRIDGENLDFNNPDIVSSVRELLIRNASEQKGQYSDILLAKCLEGEYTLAPQTNFNIKRVMEFWDHISVENFVLIRGIYALIKAEMLAYHNEFWEEAIIVSYIALDATFHLVRRKLEKIGIKNPSSHDAAKWLHDNFDKAFDLPEPTNEKYFEEFYEDRIKTIHPANRYGASPFAPIMHGDYSHLRRSLREIFAFLVSGKHGPDYHEDVKQHKA